MHAENLSLSKDAWGAEHSRTVKWRDPLPTASVGFSLSGIEYLRAMATDRLPLPPFSHLMNMRSEAVDFGRVVLSCSPDESMYNGGGVLHGGVVCGLLDTACGCALLSTLPQGKAIMSVEIKVSYLRAMQPGKSCLTATGTVRGVGKRVGFVESTAVDAHDSVVATASSTLLVIDT